MIEERKFIDDWQIIQKKGQFSFILKKVLTLGLLLLIILVVKDFIVHSLEVTVEELINKVFKNVFIAIIISVIYGAIVWVKNEKRYEKFKNKESGQQELKTRTMRDRF